MRTNSAGRASATNSIRIRPAFRLVSTARQNSAGSGRLLLIRREMGVPSAQDGGGTFSLDHLFVDGEGVPVLVEVKRSSDTRIRREVVGQMLDYAANAVKYWPLASLQDSPAATAEADGKSVDELLEQLRPGL
ncbi:hypothetical protein [Geodermatophilus normandii]|nr:hypothetical protein [Geodermatophilus normandii]